MKVLWVCNIMLPVIAEALHKEASNKEGWLSGLLEQVAAENSSDLELAVAFPVPADTDVPWRLQIAMPREKEDREHLQTNTDAETYNITCYGFHEDTVHPDRYQPLLEEELHRITEEFSPDVIHCFGTEYPHTLAVCRVFPHKEKILVGIQGICTLCAEAYFADMPESEIHKTTFRDLVKKEIVAEVKRAWAYYLYAFQLYKLYDEQHQLAEKLQQTGDLRYEQGDISRLQRDMISTLAADLHTRWIQAKEELSLAGRRFAWSCYADEPVLPADTTTTCFPVPLTHTPSQIHLDYFNSRVDEKQALLRVERSKFFPELSLGYTRQKISPLNGLNAWMVGVSFPVLFFPQQSRSRQAKIDWHIARLEADDNRRQLNNKVVELHNKLRQQQESLNYFTTAALREAGSLQQNALLQFQESEIDIVEFVQSLNSARDIRQNYIETVYGYNISVLELELYTEGNN